MWRGLRLQAQGLQLFAQSSQRGFPEHPIASPAPIEVVHEQGQVPPADAALFRDLPVGLARPDLLLDGLLQVEHQSLRPVAAVRAWRWRMGSGHGWLAGSAIGQRADRHDGRGLEQDQREELPSDQQYAAPVQARSALAFSLGSSGLCETRAECRQPSLDFVDLALPAEATRQGQRLVPVQRLLRFGDLPL